MKSFCIIGLGRFGQTLAVTLIKNGHQVMVIDNDAESVNLMADVVTNAVLGDCTSEAVLRASGVRNYDCAVVCLSQNINDSILITLLLKDIGVPKVVARASSELHKRVLLKIGADEVVFPEQDMGEKLAYMLDKNNVMEYIEFSNEYSIVEVKVPKSWIGKNMVELDIRKQYGVTIIATSNADGSEMNISPDPKLPFSASMLVTMIGADKNIDGIVRSAEK